MLVTRHSLDTPAELDRKIAELETRLVREFGANRRTTVHRVVDQERHRFDHARIHTFVPILVERSVRSRLS
jgi:hypothetical protein